MHTWSFEPLLDAEAVAQLLSKTEQQWGQEIRPAPGKKITIIVLM